MTNDATSQATREAVPPVTAPRAGTAYAAAATMDRDAGWHTAAAERQDRTRQLADMQQRLCTNVPAQAETTFAPGLGRGVPPACAVDPATEAAEEQDPASTLCCDPDLDACIFSQHADWLVEAIAARQDRPQLQGVLEQTWTASPALGGTRLQCWDTLEATPRPLSGDRCATGLPLLTVTILGSEARLDQGLVLGLDRRVIPATLSLHHRQ